MDQNCSQSTNTEEVQRSSPSKPPRLELDEVGKLSPNDRAESPDTNCAICLGKLQNKSFTDSCLHQFCFTCLLEWSKVKAECPLCKQSFKSIIHNVRSIEDYDQYHLRPSEQRLSFSGYNFQISSDDNQPRFRYRTTMVSNQPLYGYLQRLEHMMNHAEIIPPDFLAQPRRRSWRTNSQNNASSSSSSSNRRPHLISPDYESFFVPGTSGFRRSIYNRDLWVRRFPDLTGRFRECSSDFFLNNPAQIHRLVPWLNREMNVLLHGTEHDSAQVVATILHLLPLYNIRSQEFRNAMLPYLGERTDHFIHEFYAFGTSPYDMVGYDRTCLYGPRFQVLENEISDSDTDSDVQILDMVPSDTTTHPANVSVPSYEPHHEAGSPVAGPSHALENQNTLIAVSSEDSDSSDCQFVGSVKPRHLRTPEIITIDDSDSNVGANCNVVQSENPVIEESEGEIDCKPVIGTSCSSDDGGRANGFKLNYSSSKKSLRVYSSEESSGEEWDPQQRKPVSKKHKRGKKERSSSKKKVKETNKKKKVSKEKKSKPIKHWKKKLCRKIESSSSSDEEIVMSCNRKRRFLSSSSDSQTDNRCKNDYVHQYSILIKKGGNSSRLKSVVHVRRNDRDNNETPLRDSDRGPSISSVTSSRCSTNYSIPSTSSHSVSYTANKISNGDCNNSRLLLRRNRILSSSSSSSSSSLSSSCSSPQKCRFVKMKSKRKHT